MFDVCVLLSPACSFFLYLELTDEFEYTTAEKYVADKLASRADDQRWFDFFPVRQAMCLKKSAKMRNQLVRSVYIRSRSCLCYAVRVCIVHRHCLCVCTRVTPFVHCQVSSFTDMASRIDQLEDNMTAAQTELKKDVAGVKETMATGLKDLAAKVAPR